MLSLVSAGPHTARADPPAVARSGPDAAPSPVAVHDATPAAMRRDDWQALFMAVTERLHQHVEDLASDAAAGDRARPDRVAPLRECVAALQQLQREYGAPPAEAPARQHAPGKLSTREAFEHALASRLAATAGGAPALAVLCIGLDGFTRINDQYGRDVGDATLGIVARRLARALRAQDTVCRLGGDRFACLLEAPTDRDQLSRTAGKLFDALASPLRVGAVTLGVLPRIGVALCPEDGCTGPVLLHRADAAMGRAQRRQQAYALFDPCRDL